jgi:hypothetical protein
MEPLKSQKIFVIIGDEDGVAGMESLIKAAEQRLSEAAAAKEAAIAADAPKMRAVPAPHLFAKERWRQLEGSLNEVEHRLAEDGDAIRKETGSDTMPVAWAKYSPRVEQKVFFLRGTEAGIAAMESFIQAAEKLAAEEDAVGMKAEAEKSEKADTEPAIKNRGEQ